MTFVVASLPIRSEKDLDKITLLLDADFVELRLDYSTFLPELQVIERYKDKVIVTIRDVDEGGINKIDPELKAKYLIELNKRNILYDVEAKFAKKYSIPTNNKIVSIHYLDRVPSYSEVYESLRDFIKESFLLKVAVIGKDGYKELLSKLLELEKIAVMPIGVNPLERIAFSILGSKLVYGHAGEETAKGQLHYKVVKQILDYLTSISISSPSILTG
ncbi:type I 3-dehydroquinate dehydratase [Sulfolobus sp. S-194]|uniref:type I 3-dehydroquinate dehydratase n=1 Tax=Sulfolobus sp. S-194 TaxID=2512240 RepID=UPI001436FA07|nr:type I 3-dehydroquinate dehydratase [Sulfolobus sp. S-194]QIW25062.1 type I 3-dehydroquinate dehydratase [Sulfolobus sp. S-194]